MMDSHVLTTVARIGAAGGRRRAANAGRDHLDRAAVQGVLDALLSAECPAVATATVLGYLLGAADRESVMGALFVAGVVDHPDLHPARL